MKKWALLLFLFAIPLVAQTVEDVQQRQIDRLRSELEETQARLDSLVRTNNPIDLGERITKAYEAGGKHANRVVTVVGIVFGIVGLLGGILGIMGLGQARKAGDILEGARKTKDEAQSSFNEIKSCSESIQQSLTQIQETMSGIEQIKNKVDEDAKEIEKLKETLYSNLRDYREKNKELERLVRDHKTLTREVSRIDHMNRGYYYFDKEQYEKAVDAFEKAIKEAPKNPEAWFQKGYCLGKLGHHKEALKAYDETIRLKPNDTEAHYNRGVALSKLGHPDEALKAYEEAIRLKPDFAKAHSGRGIVLSELSHYEEALKACDEAIRLKPDYAEAHDNRGVALIRWGATLKGKEAREKFEEARKSVEKAIELSNGKVGHANMACVLARLGEPKEALKHLGKSKENGELERAILGGWKPWEEDDLALLREPPYLERFIKIIGEKPKPTESKKK